MRRILKSNSQVLRFGGVGIVNTALDFGLLFVFKSLGLPIGISNIASTAVAFLFSFFANKKYTFKASGANIFREMILFTLVTLFGLWVLQTIVIQLSLPFFGELTGSDNFGLLAAKLLATIVSLMWNYFMYSRVVFRTHERL